MMRYEKYEKPDELILTSDSGRILAYYVRRVKVVTVIDRKKAHELPRESYSQLQKMFEEYDDSNLGYFKKLEIERALNAIEAAVKCKEYRDVKMEKTTFKITLWDAMMVIQQYTEDACVKQKRHGLRPMITNLYEGCIEAQKDGIITRTIYTQDGSIIVDGFDKNGKPIDEVPEP